MDDIIEAVVGIHAEIPEGARTAGILGRNRRGSGILIDGKGLILTIGYLILEAERITVMDHRGKLLPASLVGYDGNSGFGLIRAEGLAGAKHARLGGSGGLKADDPAFIVRFNPDEPIGTATVISRRAYTGYWEYMLEHAILVAPPVTEYAGAALIDSDFKIVGIGSLYLLEVAGEESNLPGNMFVPTELLLPVLDEIVAKGRPVGPARPWLGVNVTEVLGHVIITRISEESPAGESGLKSGDIILRVAGKEVSGLEQFYRYLWESGRAGSLIKLQLLQGSSVNTREVLSRDRLGHYKMAPRP